MRARAAIRDIPDFPQPGILFRDITTLLAQPGLMAEVFDALWAPFEGGVDVIAGIESRGFILGATVAALHRLPFVPLRKPGKLPAATFRESYALEYGSDSLEMHQDALPAGARVLLIDDLLATGGTAAAAIRLIAQGNGRLAGVCFLAELCALEGRRRLPPDARVHALVRYE
ncbi:MAG: adenine phosphoribosyltransferase [Candidatus Eisenbacteria bacterium]|nr:adenine phosphoribosyltransferase [Candidatus Eisenbacteria bacterium]MCC7141229.1 adenine phosphoribosyltransferase [Candidatus Eisenbacteria bacterium]